MRRAIYPGSFDPLTYGHLDIIHRSITFFDEVIVSIVSNPGKSPLLPVQERKRLINETIGSLKGVVVEEFQGLTVDYARQNKIKVLIRGLRAISDFETELAMEQTNKSLYPELETIFLMSKAEYSFISSSIVKEVARLGGDVSHFVPKAVDAYLKEHFHKGQII